MRILAVAVALTWMLMQAITAQSARIATCELDWVDSSLPDAPPAEMVNERLRQLAGMLRPLGAEALVLHGVPDRATAKQLAGMLKPNYQVAFHGTFHQNGASTPAIGPAITILTRHQPFSARSVEWRTASQIDWPGGFAFVGIHAGANTFCVYVAHLPGEPAAATDRENAPMASRRDLAAQYLAHHANWLTTTLSNQLVTSVIAGDFIAETKNRRSEGAIRILQQAGFRIAIPATTQPRPATPGADMFPPRLFTALLARNADLISTTHSSLRKAPGQRTATYELTPNAAAPPTAPLIAATASSQAVKPATVSMNLSIVWPWVGGITALSLALLVCIWTMHRTFYTTCVLGRRVDHCAVVDMNSSRGRHRSSAFAPPGESHSGNPAATASPSAVWEFRSGDQHSLRPHLTRLLRDRLVSWLSLQRSTLLTAHQAGTSQVLELESRLQQVQGQFQERLRSREGRIQELEREILAKEKIIRELLRAQVRIANEAQEK